MFHHLNRNQKETSAYELCENHTKSCCKKGQHEVEEGIK